MWMSHLFGTHVGHAGPRSRVHGAHAHLVAHLAHVAGVGSHGNIEVHAVAVVHVVVGLLAELRWRLLSEHTVEESRCTISMLSVLKPNISLRHCHTKTVFIINGKCSADAYIYYLLIDNYVI